MERSCKVLTINSAQSVICKICTKQKQQMNKTMKKMVTMGTIWTLIPLWHVTVFSNSLDGRNILPKTWPQGCNAITTNFIFSPYFLGNAFKHFFFFVSLSSSWLSYSLFYTPEHTENKIEREVPGLILESGLPSSKGTEAVLSEVKPVFKITWEGEILDF